MQENKPTLKFNFTIEKRWPVSIFELFGPQHLSHWARTTIYNPIQSTIHNPLQIPHLCLSYRFFCFNYAPHFIRVQIFRLHFRGRNAQFSIRTKEWMFSEYLLNFFGSEIWVITLARATSFRQIYLISLKNESLLLYVFFKLIKITQMTPLTYSAIYQQENRGDICQHRPDRQCQKFFPAA